MTRDRDREVKFQKKILRILENRDSRRSLRGAFVISVITLALLSSTTLFPSQPQFLIAIGDQVLCPPYPADHVSAVYQASLRPN